MERRQCANAGSNVYGQMTRQALRVRGAVQGVGFRPFVWGLAREYSLSGWVLNDSDGVLMEVEGEEETLGGFVDRLKGEAPPLARIDSIEKTALAAVGEVEFQILQSVKGEAARTIMTPDMGLCDACLGDISDPQNRRYGYPFTNCTHCGPRYTITHTLPYDRAQTTMAPFTMCPACQAEYDDPADRRFHAQPNACPDCGPKLSHDIADIVNALG